MYKSRVLVFSSSRVGNSNFMEKAIPEISAFLGTEKKIIAFIPFAAVNKTYDSYTKMVVDAFKNTAYKIETVLPHNAVAVLQNAQVILVGGGNTFKLLHDLYELKIVQLIKELVQQNGIPYIGWSAGANIAGASISTTNDMPIIEPESFLALDLLPFQINPHYYNISVEGFNGETRNQRLAEYLTLNANRNIFGLPEGTSLCLDAGKLIFNGITKGFVFNKNNEDEDIQIKKINIGTDISYLVN